MTNMPNDIRRLYKLLEEEVIWLHMKWGINRQLFGTNENRIHLLNMFAPILFRVYQDTLLDDVILSISRLTDSKSQYKDQDFLTLPSLVYLINQSNFSDLKRNTHEEWRKLSALCGPFRQHRHKRIAHTNRLIVESTDTSLPGISREMIENVLENIRNLLNTVSEYFDDMTQSFKLIDRAGIDGELFIQHLEKLQTFYEMEKQTTPWKITTVDE